MSTLKFADTHNMVVFLSKPAESEGFEQIVDLLNANPIKYALTINPTIYTSCIEQLWAIVMAKTVNEEVQLQALVDGKKVIIIESTVRGDLQLEDAEGVDCLPNAAIFEQLTLIGYEKLSLKLTFYKAFFSSQWKFIIHTILQCLSAKTTAWNEFSSTMASAIICLATNQKFNFSKYVFKSMVKNMDKEMGEGLANPTDPHHTPTIIQPLTSQPQKKQKPRKPKRKDTEIPQPSSPTTNVADEAFYEEMDDSLERAATTGTSLDVEQDRGNINKTQSKATLNEPSSIGTSSGSDPRRQDTMGDTIALIGFENVSKTSNDSLLVGVNTLQSDEDSLKLKELMELCTNLQNRAIDLEKSKTSQAQEVTSLKRRVRRLEKKEGSRTHGLKRLYKVGLLVRIESSEDKGLGEEDASKHGRINDIDANEDIYLVNVHRDEDMFGVNDLEGDEVVVETEVDHEVVVETEVDHEVVVKTEVASKDVNLNVDEITLAQVLAALKSAKPKADKVMIQEPEHGTAASTRPKAKGLDKGKGITVEEPLNKKKKDHVNFDEQEAKRLQVEFDEEERLARENDKANVALTEEWNDIQAKIDADYQLAQRLQAQEQEELSDKEKAILFVQFLEQRRKHFAAKRAEEKRNRPPTKAQQRSIITELVEESSKKSEVIEESSKKAKVMEESSKKAEAEIAQESSSKRAREALEQESSKKQKLEEDKESEELKQCLEIVPDDGDDVTIDVTPLSTKSLTIVDFKIYKEGKKSNFKIIRADGNSQMYLTFGKMLKNFDREDLEVIWSIVKARFKKIEPVNYMDNFLLLNLKSMFEHHVKDSVWKNQQGLVKVLNWKLYDSCGVHCVTMQSILYYLLVEKMYPLTNHTLHQMFNNVKLQVDYECEMAFELLRLVKKQLKEGYGRTVRIKSLAEVTAAQVRVTAAKQNLVLFSNLNKKYAK
ncbi:hypothetical protein Tco_1331313 [Tanacetum coccineum]